MNWKKTGCAARAMRHAETDQRRSRAKRVQRAARAWANLGRRGRWCWYLRGERRTRVEDRGRLAHPYVEHPPEAEEEPADERDEEDRALCGRKRGRGGLAVGS